MEFLRKIGENVGIGFYRESLAHKELVLFRIAEEVDRNRRKLAHTTGELLNSSGNDIRGFVLMLPLEDIVHWNVYDLAKSYRRQKSEGLDPHYILKIGPLSHRF